ncbi:unnamed protein product [Lymnaea stagnalis]|uniref:Uncharacterized protein n=1 Tax=Lymnaea stagnalis TaxID=6523 RepID=A0AAV2H9N2_LYMST
MLSSLREALTPRTSPGTGRLIIALLLIEIIQRTFIFWLSRDFLRTMAQFCGKWELTSSDANFEEYMKVVGVTEDMRKLALSALTTGSKLVQQISRDGTKWTVGVITKEGEKADVFEEGKPTEVSTLDGRKVTAVYTLEGDQLVEIQKGNGFESRNVRKVNGETLTMTLTANNSVTCARTYKKV